ncbi:MAG: NAD(P)-dependent dehydrogenase (short-subunit alcohol dehydrogenase family) [bacterium]
MSAQLVVAIVGASGGIGAALLDQLAIREDIAVIHATFFRSPQASSLGSIVSFGEATPVSWSQLDASDEISVKEWLDEIGPVDWLINCAGMLHDAKKGPEKTIRAFDVDHFAASIRTNCLPTLLLGKYALPCLRNSSNAVFTTISARVGSIGDNQLGGWYSYRASKAALNMSLKGLSIEWQRVARNIRVLALHPGTTDSRLSKPFQKNVPAGKLFSPEKTAGLLLEQISSAHSLPSGRFIAYDGEEIPW